MRIFLVIVVLLLVFVTACGVDVNQPLSTSVPAFVGTSAAQAPTLGAIAAGTAVAAAQAVATQAASAGRTALPPAATSAANALATGAPPFQTAAAELQTTFATPAAGAVSTLAPPAETAAAAAQTAIATPLFPLPPVTPAVNGTVVLVKLVESKIDMPASIRSGPITFRVTNNGTVEHSLQIQGQGVDKKLDGNLKPGESRDLQVTLAPGSYQVFSPVNLDRDSGMALMLTVTAQ
jgi:uncharacterized cupredoxin-like copper-binding protein